MRVRWIAVASLVVVASCRRDEPKRSDEETIARATTVEPPHVPPCVDGPLSIACDCTFDGDARRLSWRPLHAGRWAIVVRATGDRSVAVSLPAIDDALDLATTTTPTDLEVTTDADAYVIELTRPGAANGATSCVLSIEERAATPSPITAGSPVAATFASARAHHPADVERVVRANLWRIRGCRYPEGESPHAAIDATIDVEVREEGNAKVTSLDARGLSPAVTSCMERAIERIVFPPPDDGFERISVTLSVRAQK